MKFCKVGVDINFKMREVKFLIVFKVFVGYFVLVFDFVEYFL